MKKLALALTFVFAVAMVAPAFAVDTKKAPVKVEKKDCAATCSKEGKGSCCKAGEAAACPAKQGEKPAAKTPEKK